MESDTQGALQADFYVNDHRLRFIPPDIMRVWWNGPCSRDEFDRIFEYTEQCMGQRRHFVLADLSQLATVDHEARKHASMDVRVKRVAGIAMLGTTFHIRVLMTMIVRAAEIIHNDSRGKLRFFDTTREAMDWIKQERERLGLAPSEPGEVHKF